MKFSTPQSIFAMRTIILSVGMLVASGVATAKLFSHHFNEERKRCTDPVAREVEFLEIPASRGVIMDRNERILTHNIESVRLVADRVRLREITAVLDGLVWNQAIHDADWAESNEKERAEILKKCRRKLEKRAHMKLTREERKVLNEQKAARGEKVNGTPEFDPAFCEQYYEAHDKLVAEVLYPYLNQKYIELDGQAPRLITREDIIEFIAQRKVEAYNKEAEAKGLPTRNYRIEITLFDDLTSEEGEMLKQALADARIRGLKITTHEKRRYVFPRMLSHVMGYVNSENVGVNGLEGYFESYLKGVDGVAEFRRNQRGQIRTGVDDRYTPPRHGLNLRLTIDLGLQEIVEQELDSSLRDFNAKRGCIVVMEPQTGNVLAMASRPAYDLNTKELVTHHGVYPRENQMGEDGKPELGEYHYAAQALYEPGSTMKAVTIAAAVASGNFNFNSVLNCTPLKVGDAKAIQDVSRRFSSLPLWAVLKKSSNNGTARAALAVGWKAYKPYLEAFGLTTQSGLPLSSMTRPRITDGSNLVNFSRLSYGYSLNISPLHMASVYATIANGGKRMQPRLVEQIIRGDGSIYDACAPKMLKQVMPERVAKELMAALESVTEKAKPDRFGQGTATRAAIPGFRVAGKTGTAKKVKPGGGYYDNRYTVSFAGIFPADKPKFVILTVVDEPKPKDANPGGGTVGAPIFKRVAERFIHELQLKPSDAEAWQKYQAQLQAEKEKAQAPTPRT